MSRRRALGPACRAVVESLENRTLLAVSSNVYDITAASYLGGSATDDAVRGSKPTAPWSWRPTSATPRRAD